MKLIKPKVELWLENQDSINQDEHLIRCSSVTHAANVSDISRVKKLLIDQGHLSMFRHITHYYVINDEIFNTYSEKYDKDTATRISSFIDNYSSCPYIEIHHRCEYWFIVANGQYILEHEYFRNMLAKFEVTPSKFIKYGGKNYMRYTFCITTQISTSRELNRVSPNNISEESTRYCNYAKDKFDNSVTLCIPHWFDIIYEGKDYDEIYVDYVFEQLRIYAKENNGPVFLKNKNYAINPKYTFDSINAYLKANCIATDNYLDLVNHGVEPQDARGVLPLDTATKVVYTYSIAEWRHILDLRYYGKTGKPHTNAFIIGSKLIEEFDKLGYKDKFPLLQS